MYKDDYISAFGKLTPSEAWKAETLEKMRALERQQREGRAGFGGPADPVSAAAPAPASAGTLAPADAPVSVSAGTGCAPTKNALAKKASAKNATAKKPVPLAVHLRRAALPIAAVAMLAILPMTTMRGCGASNSSMALQMEGAAADICSPADTAPAARDTAGGAENGTVPQTPAEAPSGADGLYDEMTEEKVSAGAASTADTAPVPDPAPTVCPSANGFAGAEGDIGNAGKEDANDSGNGKEGVQAFRTFPTAYGSHPFRALDASGIVSATVCLAPPDTTLEIPDMEELVGLLQETVVYTRDDSYTEYSGQGVIFELTFTDGTGARIMAYNPFLVINGEGYRTEYAPCEALNQYANDLLSSGEAVTVMRQPPAMAVIGTLDETYHDTLQGSYSWQSKNTDGTFTDIEADGAHPLACKTQLSPALEMENDRTLNLIFPQGAAPDEIVRVRCWSDADWGNTAAGNETVRVSGSAAAGGYTIEVKPDGYIYEVIARWDTADGYGGTASYAFYVKGIA